MKHQFAAACETLTPLSPSFWLWMDLPLRAPRHLSIMGFTDTLMTLIMWHGHMAPCVCVCVSTYDCTTTPARSSWKQIALETRPSSWSPPLESHCRGYTDRGNMAAELGGSRNGLFASASECHPRCPLLSSKSRRMSNGQSPMIAMWGHWGVTGSFWTLRRVRACHSELLTL